MFLSHTLAKLLLCGGMLLAGIVTVQADERPAAAPLAPPTIVQNVHYELDRADPGRLAGVSFTASASTQPLRVQLVLDGAAQATYSCERHQAGWYCPTGDRPLVAAIQSLSVTS
jgi:hypothetical protein